MIELKKISAKNARRKKEDKEYLFKNISLSLPNVGVFSFSSDLLERVKALFNVLAGIKAYEEGEIDIDGTNTKNFKKEDWYNYRFNFVGYARRKLLIENYTVRQNIDFILDALNLSKKEKDETVQLLTRFKLAELVDKSISKLSDEEKIKLSILLALLKDPSILLVFEPIDSLDEKGKKEIIEVLKAEAKKRLVLISSEFFDGEITHFFISNNSLIGPSLILNDSPLLKRKKTKKEKMIFSALTLSFFKEKICRNIFMVLFLICSMSLWGIFGSIEYSGSTSAIAQKFSEIKDTSIRLDGRDYKKFKEEDISKMNQKYGMEFSGIYYANSLENSNFLYPINLEINQEYQNNLNDKSFKGYFRAHYSGNIDEFASIQSLDKLPQGYKLVAGTFPNSDNSILLTDLQYFWFKTYGYKDWDDPKNNVSGEEMTPSKMVGQKLIWGDEKRLTISGILDTDFDEEEFKPFFDYIVSSQNISDGRDTPEKIQQLRQKFSSGIKESYWNLGFVSPNILASLKTEDLYSEMIAPKSADPKKLKNLALVSLDEKGDFIILNDSFQAQTLTAYDMRTISNIVLAFGILSTLIFVFVFLSFLYPFSYRLYEQSKALENIGVKRGRVTRDFLTTLSFLFVASFLLSIPFLYLAKFAIETTYWIDLPGYLVLNGVPYAVMLVYGLVLLILSIVFIALNKREDLEANSPLED